MNRLVFDRVPAGVPTKFNTMHLDVRLDYGCISIYNLYIFNAVLFTGAVLVNSATKPDS